MCPSVMNEEINHSSNSVAVTVSPIEITDNYHIINVVNISKYHLPHITISK